MPNERRRLAHLITDVLLASRIEGKQLQLETCGSLETIARYEPSQPSLIQNVIVQAGDVPKKGDLAVTVSNLWILRRLKVRCKQHSPQAVLPCRPRRTSRARASVRAQRSLLGANAAKAARASSA
eukprot:6213344-Pleurochrysis_carterae.AAC.2